MQNVRATCTDRRPSSTVPQRSFRVEEKRNTSAVFPLGVGLAANRCREAKWNNHLFQHFTEHGRTALIRSFLHRRLRFLVKESSPNSLMTMVMLLPSDSGYRGLRSKGSCKGATLYTKTQTPLRPFPRAGGLPNSSTGRGQQRPLPPPRYLPSLQG